MPVISKYPNHVWAYDFVFDRCENGRQLEVLTVEDEFTRECLAIEVDHRMGARQVCQVLLGIMATRGVRQFVRSDNGPEFIAKSLQRLPAVRESAGSTSTRAVCGRTAGTNASTAFRGECANMETFHHRDHARGGVPALPAVLQRAVSAFPWDHLAHCEQYLCVRSL